MGLDPYRLHPGGVQSFRSAGLQGTWVACGPPLPSTAALSPEDQGEDQGHSVL